MTKVLKGPSDKETNEAIEELSAEELYNGALQVGSELYFQKAVEKGLFRNRTVNEILSCSVNASSVKYIEIAISLGADLNHADKSGFTPLMTACKMGQNELINLLIDKGAVLDFQEPEMGTFALKIAVEEKQVDAVEMLIQKGAKINLYDLGGHTSLFAAYMLEDSDDKKKIIDLLERNGAKKFSKHNSKNSIH